MPEALLAERSWDLEPDASSARTARVLLRAMLDEADRAEWSEAAELAVSEVVTNAVLHARSRIRLSAGLSRDRLRVEVRDRNPAPPRERSYDTSATTGRGMALLAAVTDTHGVQSLGAAGKIVWFCVGSGGERDEQSLIDGWSDEPDLPATGAAAVRVRLLALPPALWQAARQHHDAVLRETVLFRAAHGDDPGSRADLALADQARTLMWIGLEAALGNTPGQVGSDSQALAVDVELELSPTDSAAFEAMQSALDEAERLARAGRLLVRPALPEILDVRDWACTQVLAQLDGAAPVGWHSGFDEPPGDGDRRHLGGEHAGWDDPGWDDTAVRESSLGVAAADDANRIIAVSRPLADWLGWPVESLVGRRVVVLVPYRLRQDHIAGFSRYLSTGEPHIIGRAVELPVRRADGSEASCRVLIETAPAARGRSVYLAWIEPLP